MLGLVFLFLLSVSLVGAPIGLAIAGIDIGFVSSAIMTGAGVVLMVLLGIITIITKLYQRAKANEAFVRTGMGGVKIIQDGGALVIPVIHEIVRISLETLKLEVVRDSKDAFITKDNLRADIGAEFFVRVKPERDSILQAARSLGKRMTDIAQVKAAVEDKLISALRSVAAKKTLTELHTDREGFVEEVTRVVNTDLSENGLTLESVTISKLDQTSIASLNDDNIFDAQGKRTIAEITERQKTERNILERAGEQARKQQDVETRTKILQLEQEQKNAEATQAAEIAKVTAEQDRIAKEKAIEAQKAIDLAELEKMRRTEIAAIEKKQATDVAIEAKARAIALATKEKTVEETELAKTQAIKEKEMQAIKTVEIEASAERDKRKAVIEASAKAEQAYLTEQRAADAKAYQVQKDAEARKLAADADAEATTKKALAEANAAKAHADGEKAKQLVPVEVERERLQIDQNRFENIVRPDLKAREDFGKAAQEFEIAKLKVQAEKEVKIETARAMSGIGEKISMTLYGNPDHAASMLKSLVSGQQVAELVNSFSKQIDPGLVSGVAKVVDAVLAPKPNKDPNPPRKPGNDNG